MKIVATNDDLELLDTYDLGDNPAVKGPDQNRFNQDITTVSPRQYMDQTEYTQKLLARTKHEEEKKAREEKAQAARLKFGVVDGSSR